MSHFSAIGFAIKTQEDMSLLVDDVLKVATEHSIHEHLTYLRYTDPSGAEIWLCGDNQTKAIVGAIPCFLPKQTQMVGIHHIEPIEQGQHGDGTADGWLNPDDVDGDYPLVIDLPDYLNHQTNGNPQTAYLTLFAEDVNLYADRQAFYQSQNDGLRYAGESFIPMGMFTDENDENDENTKPTAQVLVGGTVLKSELRTNQFTQNQFYWCLLQTYGANYEAVYPLDMFDKMPEVGNVVFGQYWLTGRLA